MTCTLLVATYSDDLPEKSEDDVFSALGENVRVHVDDMTADCLKVKSKIVILIFQ